MPSTDLGFYTDTTYDMNYWTFVSEELPTIVHELFPQLTHKREKTFAAGLSMGGYGALKLGLAKPENFAAVASLSGAVVLSDVESLLLVRNEAYWKGIFGPLDQIKGSKNDPLRLLDELVDSGKTAPRFFLACGTEDDLYPASQYMAHKMKQKNLNVTFEEGTGKHDWVFWDTWIKRVLEWLNEKSD
jgi:putative tributyrin esterase